MTKFRTEFEMKIDVQFVDPKKSKAFFIDGDWRNSFWQFDDLKELAEDIASSFNLEVNQWDPKKEKFCRFIEGYGTFIHENDVYVSCELSAAETGEIIIREESELEAVCTETI